MEFLVEIQVNLPPLTEPAERDRLVAAERVRGRELAEAGTIRAIWRVPGRFANRAIWSADDPTALHRAIASLPLWPYSDAIVTALADHEIGEFCDGLPAGLRP